MFNTALPSERVGIVATVDPDAYTAASPNSVHKSDWFYARDFHSFMAILMAGALGSGAEVDFALVQATNSSGAGEKAIAGKSITQLAQSASPSESDVQCIINLRTEELDVDGGFDYVQAQITLQDATSDLGAIVLGLDPRFGPATDVDLASVVEVIS